MSARDVVVAFGGHVVLDGVSVDVRAGDLTALVGPNGAGKSTLLGVLSGDLEPTSGTVEIAGRRVRDWTGVELAQRRGVLPQRSEVSFPFVVEQIVRMGREPWRATEHEDVDDEIVAWAVDATDVGHLLHRRFPSLSGGEAARSALARVLAQRPGLLLLDEPTAALDVAHQEQVLGIASARAAAGDAVVVVLHDLGLAAAYADRVVVVHDARVVADGPPSSVLTGELLSGVYGCDIEVVRHPRTDALIVVPVRGERIDLAAGATSPDRLLPLLKGAS